MGSQGQGKYWNFGERSVKVEGDTAYGGGLGCAPSRVGPSDKLCLGGCARSCSSGAGSKVEEALAKMRLEWHQAQHGEKGKESRKVTRAVQFVREGLTGLLR